MGPKAVMMAKNVGLDEVRHRLRILSGLVLLAVLVVGLAACGTVQIDLATEPAIDDAEVLVTAESEGQQQASAEILAPTATVTVASVTPTDTSIDLPTQAPSGDEAEGAQPSMEGPTPTAAPVTATVSVQAPIGQPLPAPVYYINADDSQIWRVEEDALALTQITFEEAPVTDFDVSPKDEALVYISENNLIYYSSALGGRRQILMPSHPDYDESDYISSITQKVYGPKWSPDGAWIVYGEGGINLYQDPAGPRQEGVPEVRNVLANDPLPDPLPDLDSGFEVEGPQRMYRPLSWLPDGQRVLIEESYYFALGNVPAILNLEDGSVLRIEGPRGLPCCQLVWGQQSDQLLYAGSTPGMGQLGLSRLDPATGQITEIVPGEWGGEFHLVAHPFEVSADEVYGFYASEPATPSPMPSRGRPLVMVSVAADGSAELSELRQDYLVVGEADWLPDGSGAVINDIGGQQGGWELTGPLRWLPSDGSPAVTLPAQGRRPQWGQIGTE